MNDRLSHWEMVQIPGFQSSKPECIELAIHSSCAKPIILFFTLFSALLFNQPPLFFLQ